MTAAILASQQPAFRGGGGPTFLPAVTPAPLAGWASARRLYSTSSTNALTATRLSPAGSQDIGFDEDGVFDTAAATAFKGASTLTAGPVFDQTGGGNDLAVPGNIPTLSPAVTAGDKPALWIADGGPCWLGYSAARPLVVPPVVTFDRADCTIFLVCRTPGQGATSGYFMFGDAANADFGLRSYAGGANGYTLQPIVAGANPVAAAPNNKTIGLCNLSIIAVNSNGTRLRVYRDEQFTDFPAAASLVLNDGGLVGSTFTLNGRIDVEAFEVIPGALSDVAMAARLAAYKTMFGTPAAITASYFFSGDSIYFGTGGVNNRTITAALSEIVTSGVHIRNSAIAGSRLQDNVTTWQVLPLRFYQTGVPNWLFVNWGHNDIFHDIADLALTPAQCLTKFQTNVRAYCTDARNLADFDYIVWSEILPDTSGGVSWTADMETARGLINTWLNTNPVDNDGVICFNAVDHVATDDVFPLSNFETTAGRGMALAANSSDGTHPNEGVDGAIANYRAAHLLATINAAVPTPLAIVGTPVTTAAEDVAYTGFSVSGRYGTAPYTYSVQSGALPTGITLNAVTGAVSGTPTVSGPFANIVLRVTDAALATADLAPFTITVSAGQQVVVESETDSFSALDVTALNVNLPATVNAGDLLLAFVAIDANTVITWDNVTAGAWTSSFVDGQTANRLQVFSRIADGTEDGKVLAITFATAQQAVVRVFRLSATTGALSVSAAGARSTGSTTPDPGSVTASWGVLNNFFIAAAGLDNAVAITAGPTGYSTPNTRITSASGQAGLSTCYKNAAAATDNPSAFTSSTSIAWVCATIVVRPS